jgi:Predicted permease
MATGLEIVDKSDGAEAAASEAPARVVLSNYPRIILFGVGAYLFLLFFDAIAKALLLFLFAFLMAIALNAPVRRLEARGVSRTVSVFGVLVLLAGVLVLLGRLVGPPLVREAEAMAANAPEFFESLRRQADRWTAQVPALGRYLDGDALKTEQLLERATGLLPRIGRYTLGVFGGIATTLFALVTALYTLANPRPLVRGLLTAVPPAYRETSRRALARIVAQLEAWAVSTLVLMLIVGVLTGIGLAFLRVPNALLFAVLAGLGEAIPTIGPILTAVPPMLVALAHEPTKALWVAGLFLVIQQVENNVLVPWIMSRNLNLHPVSILFFVLSLGAVLGIVGALLAVPVAIIVKVLFDEFYAKRRPPDPSALEGSVESVIHGGDIPRPAPAPTPKKTRKGG